MKMINSGKILAAALALVGLTGKAFAQTAPPMTITSPSDGSTIVGVTTVTVVAGIGNPMSSVQLLKDGNVFATSASAGPVYNFTWNTSTDTLGLHTLTAVGLDSLENFLTSNSVTVTVSSYAVTPAPSITSALMSAGQVGSAYSYQITATNGPTKFGASGLPAGLSVSTATGHITGTPSAAGYFNVTLSAVNSGGTGSAVLFLTVNPAPPPAPVITSALTAIGQVGASFGYQIVATNSPTSFSAVGLPSGLSLNAGSGLISGTPTAIGVSSVTISATNSGGTGTALLQVTINAALPPAPVITSALTATGQAGSAFSYQITATNSPTNFNASGLPAGLNINTGNGQITGTPTAAAISTVTISATNAGGTGSAALRLTVNLAPSVLTSIVLTPAGASINVGGTQQFGAVGKDQYGNTMAGISFSFTSTNTAVASINSAGLASGLAAGSSRILASSGGITSNSAILTVSLAPSVLTSIVLTPANASINVGGAQQFAAVAKDQYGNTMTGISFSFTSSNTAVASINSSGLASGLAAGSSRITASSGIVASNSALLTVNAVLPSAPVITSALTASGQVGSSFSYQITATNSPISFGAAGLPAGLSFSGSVISGTPTAVGVSSITISATNSGGTGSATLLLSVSLAPSVLTSIVLTPASASINVGGAQQFNAVGKDQYGSTMTGLSFSFVSTNTSVASINSSGLASGLAAGSSRILASNGAVVSNSAILTVSAVLPAAPVITSALTAAGQAGSAFNYQITATNNPTSFGAAGLPAGLSLNTGSGQITGTPTNTTTVNVTISATNTGGTGSATLILTINPAPSVLTSIALSPASASINIGATQQFVAVAKDQNGSVMNGVAFSFFSSASGVASINGSGLASGISAGQTSITAASNGVTSNAAQLTVNGSTIVVFGPGCGFIPVAVAAANAVVLTGNVTVQGSAQAGASFSASGNVRVTGDVTSPSIQLTGNSQIQGNRFQSTPAMPVPPFNFAAAMSQAQTQNNNAAIPSRFFSNGALVMSCGDFLTIPAGTYYFTGMALNGQAHLAVSGNVTIFLHGSLFVSGGAMLNEDGVNGSLWIYSDGASVSDSGNSRSVFNLYSPQAYVSLTGNSRFVGCVAAKSVVMSGGTIESPSSLQGTGDVHITNHNENGHNGSCNVVINASGNPSISRVEVYDNDDLIQSKDLHTPAPWMTMSLTGRMYGISKREPTQHVIKVKTYNVTGAVFVSDPITVTVAPSSPVRL